MAFASGSESDSRNNGGRPDLPVLRRITILPISHRPLGAAPDRQYERTFRVLRSLPFDIFLGAHGNYSDLDSKYGQRQDNGSAPFVDPEGSKRDVAEREQACRTELAQQPAARPQTRYR